MRTGGAAAVLLAAGLVPVGPAYGADDRALDAALRSVPAGDGTPLPGDDADAPVRLGWFTQFRYIMNFRDGPASSVTASDSGFTNGFEMVRTRVEAAGNLHGKDLSVKVSAQFGPTGTDFTLVDAYTLVRLDNRYSLEVGQFKLPLWREWSVEPTGQLTADTSLMTEAFNPGYTQGVQLNYTGDRFRMQASFSDGIRAANTAYNSPIESDAALAARLDFKGAGDWSLFDDFTAWRGQPSAWMAGVGIIFNPTGGTATTARVTQQTLLMLAADVSYEGSGWNVYGALVAVHANPDSGDIKITDYGTVVQGGYFVTDAVEVFGRWDAIYPDRDRGPAVAMDSQTITTGANWYLFPKSHAAKVTGDVQWFVNETFGNGIVRPLFANNVAGIRSDHEGDQFTVRFQFQLVF